MSATLDGVSLSRVLGDVPLFLAGRSHPVETHYLSYPWQGSNRAGSRAGHPPCPRRDRRGHTRLSARCSGNRRTGTMLGEGGSPMTFSRTLSLATLTRSPAHRTGSRFAGKTEGPAIDKHCRDQSHDRRRPGRNRRRTFARAAVRSEKGMTGLDTIPVSVASADQKTWPGRSPGSGSLLQTMDGGAASGTG